MEDFFYLGECDLNLMTKWLFTLKRPLYTVFLSPGSTAGKWCGCSHYCSRENIFKLGETIDMLYLCKFRTLPLAKSKDEATYCMCLCFLSVSSV